MYLLQATCLGVMLRGRGKTIKKRTLLWYGQDLDVKKVKRKNKPSSLGVCSEPNAPTVLEVCREGAGRNSQPTWVEKPFMNFLAIHLNLGEDRQ